MSRGYNVISGGTDNHLVLVDLRNKDLTGKVAERALQAADITVNKNMVPFDDKSPFVTSGIRLGSPAVTTRGFTEEAMHMVVRLIDTVLQKPADTDVQRIVRHQVNDLAAQHPLYDFVTG